MRPAARWPSWLATWGSCSRTPIARSSPAASAPRSSSGRATWACAATSCARAVDGAMAAVGLAEAARTNPYDLGASRRKLLALASVLAMRTPVLVLDEPTTGQDWPGWSGSPRSARGAGGRTHRHRDQPRHGVRGHRVRAGGGHGRRPCPGGRHAGGGLRSSQAGSCCNRPTWNRRWRRESATGWDSAPPRPRPRCSRRWRSPRLSSNRAVAGAAGRRRRTAARPGGRRGASGRWSAPGSAGP